MSEYLIFIIDIYVIITVEVNRKMRALFHILSDLVQIMIWTPGEIFFYVGIDELL